MLQYHIREFESKVWNQFSQVPNMETKKQANVHSQTSSLKPAKSSLGKFNSKTFNKHRHKHVYSVFDLIGEYSDVN